MKNLNFKNKQYVFNKKNPSVVKQRDLYFSNNLFVNKFFVFFFSENKRRPQLLPMEGETASRLLERGDRGFPDLHLFRIPDRHQFHNPVDHNLALSRQNSCCCQKTVRPAPADLQKIDHRQVLKSAVIL